VSTGNSTDSEPLLKVRGIDCSYGPLQVLFGVDLDVPSQGRVALLGTNGAGKSTLLRVISGLISPTRGTVIFKGEDITKMPPWRRVQLGMSLIQGGQATFPSLSLLENLRLGGYPFFSNQALIDERVDAVLALFPPLAGRLRQAAGTLSGGEQHMMTLGRAFVAQPDLLIIDELSLGLAPVITKQIVRTVQQLDRRTTLLLVDQSLNIALSLVDHAYFMEKGEVRDAGSSSELLERGDEVRSSFFGQRETP
jgi:ABC-type branched-subunit amino acid transport system ATPase component